MRSSDNWVFSLNLKHCAPAITSSSQSFFRYFRLPVVFSNIFFFSCWHLSSNRWPESYSSIDQQILQLLEYNLKCGDIIMGLPNLQDKWWAAFPVPIPHSFHVSDILSEFLQMYVTQVKVNHSEHTLQVWLNVWSTWILFFRLVSEL